MIQPIFPTVAEGGPSFTPIYWQRVPIMTFTTTNAHKTTKMSFNGDCGVHFSLSDLGLASNFFVEIGYRPLSSEGPVATITPTEQRNLQFVLFRLTGNGDGGSAIAEWYDDTILGLRTAIIASPSTYSNGQVRFNWRGQSGLGSLKIIKSDTTVVDIVALAGVGYIDRNSITLGGTRVGSITNFITDMHTIITGQPAESGFLKGLYLHVGFPDLLYNAASTGGDAKDLMQLYKSISDFRTYTRLISMTKLIEHSRQNIPHEEIVP